MLSDTAGLIDFADRDGAAKGPMGCVGYCMGGRHVLCVAGTYPERFRATAGLHGVNLVTDQPDSPHRIAQKAQGELYLGHGEKDPFSSPEVLKALDEAFRGRAFRHHSVVHKGVDHGYGLPDRDVFDKHAVNRDWEVIFGMFRRQLPA